jgi:hypothetical protein
MDLFATSMVISMVSPAVTSVESVLKLTVVDDEADRP